MKLDSRIDAYIAAQTPAAQERLAQLRAIIHRVFPEAFEDISYKMPAEEPFGSIMINRSRQKSLKMFC